MILTAAALRLDKKCGKSGIADNKKCGKKTSPSTITKVALGAGAVAGVAGLALFARRRWGRRDPNWKGFSAPGEDWDRIEAEARQGGKKWDVFEENKRDKRIACAAAKVDSWVREDIFYPFPTCLEDAGAFGNYIVHPSEKYGIKYLHNAGNEPTAVFRAKRDSLLDEGYNLKLANDIGVPSPKLLKASDKALVMEHLPQFHQLAKESWAQPFGVSESAPFEVKRGLSNIYRTLHINGLAHTDAHARNVLYNPRTKELRLIDFGNAVRAIDEFGSISLVEEMRDVPARVGLPLNIRTAFEDKWEHRINEATDWFSEGYDGRERAARRVKAYYSSLNLALSRADRMAGGTGVMPISR
jgi:tRNA A-37 threonylcarbamoyl transferase component Bud32